MDFFNKTKESLKNAGAAISQKANGVQNTVSLSMKIKETEKTIKECYMDVAKLMVDDHYDELFEICPELCNRIQEAKKQLEKDKRALAIAKGLQICPNCGSEENNEVVCCTKCGTNIQEAISYMNNVETEAEAAVETTANVCPNCGKDVEGSAFCPHCGTKLS